MQKFVVMLSLYFCPLLIAPVYSMVPVEESVVASAILQAEGILKAVQMQEPWYKPVTGFTLGQEIGKRLTSEPVILASTGVGGVLLLYSSIRGYYLIKAGEGDRILTGIKETFQGGASLLGKVVSSPEVWLATGAALTLAGVVKLSRILNRKSIRGACLIAKSRLEFLIKDLKAVDACYNLDFKSGVDAENCSRKMYATSAWPLIELQQKIGNYYLELDLLYNQLVGMEKKLRNNKEHGDCVRLKDAALCLAVVLSNSVKFVNDASSIKDQETRYTAYISQGKEHEQREKDRAFARESGAISGNTRSVLFINAGK